MGASAFLKSVDFTAFAVNVKTIAPTQKLYQSGHAIWWGTTPPVVNTFLNNHDFSGKTVIPFCTSGGSGSLGNINRYCAGADILQGRDLTGDGAGTVRNWLTGIGVLQ